MHIANLYKTHHPRGIVLGYEEGDLLVAEWGARVLFLSDAPQARSAFIGAALASVTLQHRPGVVRAHVISERPRSIGPYLQKQQYIAGEYDHGPQSATALAKAVADAERGFVSILLSDEWGFPIDMSISSALKDHNVSVIVCASYDDVLMDVVQPSALRKWLVLYGRKEIEEVPKRLTWEAPTLWKARGLQNFQFIPKAQPILTYTIPEVQYATLQVGI